MTLCGSSSLIDASRSKRLQMSRRLDLQSPDAPDRTGEGVPTEAELVERLKSGDQRAYEIAVRRHGGAMLGSARRIVNDNAAAEDCVQEAFLNAFRGIGGFEGRSSLATWLTRITINAALMRLRKQRRAPEQAIDPLMPEFDGNGCRIEPTWRFPETVEETMRRKEVRTRVIEAVQSLPDSYRTVIMLRDIEELSTAEVAAMLKTTEGAVKTKLHRARAALKRLLEPMWAEDLS